jgi:hypothetical protein
MLQTFAGVTFLIVNNASDGTDQTTLQSTARQTQSLAQTLPFTANISVWSGTPYRFQVTIVPAAINPGDTTETTNSISLQFKNLPANATVFAVPSDNTSCPVPRSDVPLTMSYCNAGTAAAPRVLWTVGQSYTFSVRSP